MISISSTAVLESRILPGVRVTCRKFSVSRRQALELELAEFREKRKELVKRMLDSIVKSDIKDDDGNIVEKGDGPEERRRKVLEQVALKIDVQALDSAYLIPAYLKHYVLGIEGLEIDGRPANAADLLGDGLQNLADEVYQFIQSSNGLPPGEQKPSGSPGTSEPQEGIKTPTTTATTAEPAD